jgi:AcrR family transcriptional regulator
MDAVADAAGVGKGTIYHYYSSKAELLSALRARHLQRIVAGARAAATAGRSRSMAQGLQRFIEALLASTVDNGELIWILFHQTATDGDNELAPVYDAMLELVRQGVATGEFGVTDPEFAAEFLLHGLHGVVESAFHRGDLDLKRLNAGMSAAMRALLMASSADTSTERPSRPHRQR